MTLEDERKIITEALEKIFTIDGKGRPAKAQLFLLLMDKYGKEQVVSVVRDLAARKNF